MRLDRLTLRNFRNYTTFETDFAPGVNLIVGDNAQGKTNLLEAIAYLGGGRSFRAQKTGELIRFSQEFAECEGSVYSQERQQTIRWVLFSGQKTRQIFLNGVKKKTAGELSGVLQTVLFCPEDLMVFKAGAAARRRLGDSALCQIRPNYEAALGEYNRILERKSRILKDRFENPALMEVLPEYNERLCQVGALLISYRARFFEGLGKAMERYHNDFSGGKEECTLTYRTVSTVTDPFAPPQMLVRQLQAHLQAHYRAELDSGQCLTGPHRDDFDVNLSGKSLKTYGSQGQVRTAAISIKLAQRELMAHCAGQMPVLLLDDVLSELDPARQDFILNRIGQGQVFITCCEKSRFPEAGKTLEIENGKCTNL